MIAKFIIKISIASNEDNIVDGDQCYIPMAAYTIANAPQIMFTPAHDQETRRRARIRGTLLLPNVPD